MNLKQLLGLCEHKWSVIGNADVYQVDSYGNQVGSLPIKKKVTLKCDKCGEVKSNNV